MRAKIRTHQGVTPRSSPNDHCFQ